MKKIAGILILKLFGWTDDYPKENVDKFVMISAPYTSFWDYVFGIASFWKTGTEVKMLCNDDEICNISSYFFKKLKGRKFKKITKKGIDFSVDLLKNTDKLALMIVTESHREKVDKWETNFHKIAQLADVPIALGYIDYSDRMLGVAHFFKASEDMNKDMSRIESFYENFTPKFVNGYNQKIC